MQGNMKIDLRRSYALIRAHNALKLDILKGSKAVLDQAKNINLLEEFREGSRVNIRNAKRIIEEYQSRDDLKRFDIFRIVGFVANENYFSNAVAALLDPNKTHGLDDSVLRHMLKSIHHRDPRRVNAVINALDQSKYITVNREVHEDKSIPDISIESDKFIIFIENKKRGGQETSIKKRWQTKRHWNALEKKRNEIGMSEDSILGILLSPEGVGAQEQNFISLSYIELTKAIQDAIDEKSDKSSRSGIRHFLNFFQWE